MKDWRGIILGAVERAEHYFDRFKLFLKIRYGWLGPVEVVPYRGHGTQRELHLVGRVLEERLIREAAEGDSAWRNLRTTVKRFLSAEVPGARVRIGFQGRERTVVADDEGFFDVCLEPREPLPADGLWHEVELDLLWPIAKGQRDNRTKGEVLVPPTEAAGASFGVVSDIDDTILRSEATNLLTMLRLVLFSNFHTRLPFEGVAAFYRALREGDGGRRNPIFYVSTGPWNLYDPLAGFLELRGIPAGPIFLKDWGGLKDLLRGMNHRRHKLEVIRGVLDTHSTLPFVLVGDSGQEDAETYGQIAREYPGRILAIYIRDVSRKGRDRVVHEISERTNALGVPMLLVQDTVAAAEHAVSAGLILAGALPGIREERREEAGKSVLTEVTEALHRP